MKVEVLKSYVVNDKIENSHYFASVKNVNDYFNKLIDSAELLAKTLNGSIHIDRHEKSLYISYLDILNTSKIDSQYIIVWQVINWSNLWMKIPRNK